ncbi:MAG: hypothetical protein IJN78_01210 [Clostridia bacterium]|nr:hypothetical protein [Clostridia bacterium]
MKNTKRIVSFLLSAIMVVTTFLAVGPVFTIETAAADSPITIGGITQQRVVSDYAKTYAQYQSRFFNGSTTNWPTNIVIPGLSSTEDYTPQGMTYWAAKEWILISAYDASGAGKNSVIYAIDAATTKFVALFKVVNSDGSVNTSHGGGIAASDYNFYYADKNSYISYWPLSEMDVPENTVKEIKIRGSIDCSGELNGAATSYCCYDEGVLWTGNFEWESTSYDYSQDAHPNYQSGLFGYRLKGNSSEQEWYYLANSSVPITLNNNGGQQTWGSGDSTMTYTTTKNADGSINISGNVNTNVALGEITASFASFKLNANQTYVIEFTSTNNWSDMYMFAPTGNHCNVKQASSSKITKNSDNTYTYRMEFTAGVKPSGADSSWPSAATSAYTGTYTIRFDQDSISAGSNYSFTIKNFTIKPKTNNTGADTSLAGSDCAGNPTYCIFFADGIDRIQYAMVDSGRIYMSRSWSRSDSGNHIRELDIADLDIHSVGGTTLTVNNRSRDCHIVSASKLTKFGGAYKTDSLDQRNKMLFMGEALCVMDGYLYMFGEGAAYTYNGKEDSKCPEPIDVIWKIDQYAIMGEERTTEDIPATHYQKVNSLAEITDDDEYIIVFESSIKDPVTQKNYLYAIDSYGNYGDAKLPKNDSPTEENTYDVMGIVGYQIDRYTLEEDGKLYLQEEDEENKSIRWKISGANGGNLRIKNMDPYFSSHRNLLVGPRVFSLSSDSAASSLNRMALDMQNGHFRLFYSDQANTYPIWCNDGTNQSWIDTYSNYYKNHGKSYTPVYNQLDETVGTFHADAYRYDSNSGNLTGNGIGLAYQYLDIYKRIPDEHAIVNDSKVYTDLSVDLQSDGTYNITLEAYATSSLQYKTLPADKKNRPTDYVLVLDTSGSMQTAEKNYYQHQSFDLEAAAGSKSVADHTNNSTNSSTWGYYTGGKMVMMHTDGNLYTICCNVQGDGRKLEWGYTYYQRVYLYYTVGSTNYWYHPSTGQWTTTQTTYDEAQRVGANSKEGRYNTNVFNGICYEQNHDNGNQFNFLKITANTIAGKILSENADSNIALVTFGGGSDMSGSSDSDRGTGLYTTSGSFVAHPVAMDSDISDSNYKSAFFNKNQIATLQSCINNIPMNSNRTSFVEYGVKMASKILEKSGNDYTYNGDRNAVILVITDGIPGQIETSNDDTYKLSSALGREANANFYASKAKNLGAYVYTACFGTDTLTGFGKDDFLAHLSSEYIDTRGLGIYGDKNPSQEDYTLDGTDLSTVDKQNTFTSTTISEIESNNEYALAKLDTNAVIQEKLNLDAFKIDSSTSITAETRDAHYDGLGRLYFDEEGDSTTISSSKDLQNGIIKVWGYDFSKSYVAPANEANAKKLVINITGVLPSEKLLNSDGNGNNFINVPVNVVADTGVYQNADSINEEGKHQTFPEDRIIIPQYTYVLDYGKPMFDPDVYGTVESIDSQIRKQTNKSATYNDNGIRIAPLRDAEGTDDLLYTVTPATKDVQSAYVLIKRPNGTSYDWFRLNIVPASTVHFEETWLSVKTRPEGTTDADLVDWTPVGSSNYYYQSLSGSNDIYGQDKDFVGFTGAYSDNTYSTVTVSDTTNTRRSETLTTFFAGTGIDLYSTCGRNTGMQVVAIKNSAGTLVKSYVVDTFFNGETFTQVPIVRFKGAHDVYTIEVTAAYLSYAGAIKFGTQSFSSEVIDESGHMAYTTKLSATYEEQLLEELGFEELVGSDVELVYFSEDSILNGGEGAFAVENDAFTTQGVTSLVNYIDGFRTYKPLAADYEEHYIMSEKNATYYDVIDLLDENSADAGATFVEIIENVVQGSAYNSQNAPKGEFYLQKSTSGLTFQIPNWQPGVTKLMISARAAKGQPNLKINNAPLGVLPTTMSIFYDVSEWVTDDGVVVIINQTDGAILALDSIKISDPSGGISPLAFDSMSVVGEILAMPEVEGSLIVSPTLPDEFVDQGTPPELPDFSEEPNEPDDGHDNVLPPSDDNNPEEPAEDGFFAKVESFFVKIFNFFKNIFNKVSTFFKF